MNIKNHYETLECKIEQNGILEITINRPSKLNALSVEVLSELKEVLSEANKDEAYKIRGIYLTGAGEKAFIAGADIAAMSDMTPSDAYQFGNLGQQVTLLLENMKVPVIAGVNGFALGGGLEMAMSADFMLATDNAVFGQPEVKLGLIPGFGGTQRLAKLVGRNLAKEMIFTGRNIDARQAVEMKLVLKTFANSSEMKKGAWHIFSQIEANSPFAVSIAKKVMNEGIDLTTIEGLQLEKRQFSSIFSSDDMREGTKAFVEKRKAQFKGC